MWFIEYIIEQLVAARDSFYDAYEEVKGWIYPFYYLQYPLYGIYIVFYYLAQYFTSFNQWLDWVAQRVSQILSYDNIMSYFRQWFDAAWNAWTWVYNAAYNIWSGVNDWWSSTSQIVQGWINSAVAGWNTLLNQANSWLASLQNSWSNFTSNILPTLLNTTLANGLIQSWFSNYTPFWSGWQDVRSQVVTFITDPLQWIHDRMDEFFERFW